MYNPSLQIKNAAEYIRICKEEKKGDKMIKIITQITLQELLQEEKENLERRLADVNAVLESLKNTPEVANVVEALNKLGLLNA